MQQFSKDEHPPKGSAPSFYTDPKVEEMIKAALAETDPQKRQDMYCQLNKIVWDDAPWLFLWTQRFPIVYSSRSPISRPIRPRNSMRCMPAGQVGDSG